MKTLLFIVFTLLGFIILPLLGIILPIILPYLLKRRLQIHTHLPFKHYWGSMLVLILAANVYWNTLVYNKIYYEWDAQFVKYTLLTYESPILDGSPSWIAVGWHTWQIYVLWLFLTVTIYSISLGIALCKHRKSRLYPEYKKILLLTSYILVGLSLIMSPLVTLLAYVVLLPLN